jgi:putative peptide zinc metalloprotease protein
MALSPEPASHAAVSPPDEIESPRPTPLADKLRNAVVGLRADLDISRHVMRGRAAYVVRDPVSFETHAFSAADYRLLVALNGERTLGEAFASSCEQGACKVDDEESFYRFILDLHRSGLLSLPISNDRQLQERHERNRAARVTQWLLAPLFLRIPVWNPDTFLSRTQRLARPLFTTWAFIAWCAMIVGCTAIVTTRWNDLKADLPGLLAWEQLLSMWVVLIVLKVIHEFGHGYAVKCFGGAVPEMGVSLVVLTPSAYVDASASWGFPDRIRRMVVCLAGVYFESFVAAAALVAWSMTEAGPVHTIAHQVMVMASITTIGFNLNPLLRFDGYFLLSDLVQIPNLWQVSRAHALRVLRRVALGVDGGGPTWTRAEAAGLFVYAVASSVFKFSLMLAICAIIALKFAAVGMIAALAYGGYVIASSIVQAMRYLCWSTETAPVRGRAIVAAAAMLVVPATLLSLPMPRAVRAEGVIEAQVREQANAVEQTGVGTPLVADGTEVRAGDPILRLESTEVEDALNQAKAQWRVASLELELAEANGPVDAAVVRHRIVESESRLKVARARADALTLRAPVGGVVTLERAARELGRVVPAGTPLARVDGGPRIATLILDQRSFAALPETLDHVEFRCLADPALILRGKVRSISPAADTTLASPALAVSGGGSIAVSPLDGRAASGHVELKAEIEMPEGVNIPLGARVEARFPLRHESLLRRWYGAVVWFNEELAAAR